MGNQFLGLLTAPADQLLEEGGYRAFVAENEADLTDAVELRSRVFVEEGFIAAADNGVLRDDLDGVSAHFIIRKDSRVVATTRLVLPSPRGYLTERLFDFEAPSVNRSRLGEFGRLAIDRAHRGGERVPMLLLLAMVYRSMCREDIEWVYAFLPRKLANSYAVIGCVSHPLAVRAPSAATVDRRSSMRGYFERQDVQPVLFQLTEMLREIRAR